MGIKQKIRGAIILNEESFDKIFLRTIIQRLTMHDPNLVLNLKQFTKKQITSVDSLIFVLIGNVYNTPNMLKLAMEFPQHVYLWQDWQDSDNEEKFFKKYLPVNMNHES